MFERTVTLCSASKLFSLTGEVATYPLPKRNVNARASYIPKQWKDFRYSHARCGCR